MLDPPVPVHAYVTLPLYNFRVVFNRPLLPGPVHPLNWHFRYLSRNHAGTTAVASGYEVNGTSHDDGAAPPGANIDYLAMPPDVRSILDIPAQAFEGFPIAK